MIEWLPVPMDVLAIAMLVTVVAATLQGTIGFGFAVASVPVLALIDSRLAPVPQLLVVLPLTITMTWRERASLDLKGLGWVLVGRVIGAVLGVVLLKFADKFIIDLSIAGIVFIAVICLSLVTTVPRNRLTESIAGTVSGIGAMVSSIGGPPLALLYRDARGGTLRSSLAAIFAIGLTITIVTRAGSGLITRSDVIIAVCLLPAVFLGLFFSQFLIGRIEGPPLRRAILIVATLCAIGLTIRAFS